VLVLDGGMFNFLQNSLLGSVCSMFQY